MVKSTKYWANKVEHDLIPDWLVILILILLSLGLCGLWVVGYLKSHKNPTEAIVVPLVIEERLPISMGNTIIGTEAVRQLEFKSLGSTWFAKIIQCESGGNPKAKNPNSTARGLLQIIKSSELFCEKGLKKGLDMYNPEDNLLCGEYLMEHGGLSHWTASQHCWEK